MYFGQMAYKAAHSENWSESRREKKKKKEKHRNKNKIAQTQKHISHNRPTAKLPISNRRIALCLLSMWFGPPLLFLACRLLYSLCEFDDWKSMIYNAPGVETEQKKGSSRRNNMNRRTISTVCLLFVSLSLTLCANKWFTSYFSALCEQVITNFWYMPLLEWNIRMHCRIMGAVFFLSLLSFVQKKRKLFLFVKTTVRAKGRESDCAKETTREKASKTESDLRTKRTSHPMCWTMRSQLMVSQSEIFFHFFFLICPSIKTVLHNHSSDILVDFWLFRLLCLVFLLSLLRSASDEACQALFLRLIFAVVVALFFFLNSFAEWSFIALSGGVEMNAVHYRLESDIIYTFCGIQHQTHTVSQLRMWSLCHVDCCFFYLLRLQKPKTRKYRNCFIAHNLQSKGIASLIFAFAQQLCFGVCVCVARCLNLDICVHIFSRSQRRTYF